jgi:hypothetical protein
MKSAASLSIGVDHDNYRHVSGPLAAPVRNSLTRDLD